jgi:hypothetical protein
VITLDEKLGGLRPDDDAVATLTDLIRFCADPAVDSLLRIESEGGNVWEFDAKQFLLAMRAIEEP